MCQVLDKHILRESPSLTKITIEMQYSVSVVSKLCSLELSGPAIGHQGIYKETESNGGVGWPAVSCLYQAKSPGSMS